MGYRWHRDIETVCPPGREYSASQRHGGFGTVEEEHPLGHRWRLFVSWIGTAASATPQTSHSQQRTVCDLQPHAQSFQGVWELRGRVWDPRGRDLRFTPASSTGCGGCSRITFQSRSLAGIFQNSRSMLGHSCSGNGGLQCRGGSS